MNLLCINSPDRSPEFPDTPTLTECGYPNSDLPSWYAIWAPVGMPGDIIEKFHARVVEIIKDGRDEAEAASDQRRAADPDA